MAIQVNHAAIMEDCEFLAELQGSRDQVFFGEDCNPQAHSVQKCLVGDEPSAFSVPCKYRNDKGGPRSKGVLIVSHSKIGLLCKKVTDKWRTSSVDLSSSGGSSRGSGSGALSGIGSGLYQMAENVIAIQDITEITASKNKMTIVEKTGGFNITLGKGINSGAVLRLLKAAQKALRCPFSPPPGMSSSFAECSLCKQAFCGSCQTLSAFKNKCEAGGKHKYGDPPKEKGACGKCGVDEEEGCGGSGGEELFGARQCTTCTAYFCAHCSSTPKSKKPCFSGTGHNFGPHLHAGKACETCGPGITHAMTMEDLLKLKSLAVARKFAPSEIIMERGDQAILFYVLDGTCTRSARGMSGLPCFRGGNIAGTQSFLSKKPSVETVEAGSEGCAGLQISEALLQPKLTDKEEKKFLLQRFSWTLLSSLWCTVTRDRVERRVHEMNDEKFLNESLMRETGVAIDSNLDWYMQT